MTGVVALIVAGGRGERFGSGVPKQYQLLSGVPMLRRAVEPFVRHPGVDRVRVVYRAADHDLYASAMAGLDLDPPVAGGDSRQESARLGLESLAPDPPGSVLIHDAARPCCPSDLIDRALEALKTAPAAVPAVPVQDTLKREAPDRPGVVAATVDRAGLYRAQTPQAFRFEAILAAHRQFAGEACTDDAAVAERAGLAVVLVPGDEANIKITTPADIRQAERGAAVAATETRTGIGFDVHRFGPGNHVMLGGIAIPHIAGLIGHSDADVALHAATDAILGAMAAGDIGSHFPPSDPRWRGAPSAHFLRHAAGLVARAGGEILHLDITIICERPKIGPYRPAMTVCIADILGLDPRRVSVKATTTERLGFTGRSEGIAAQAAATVRLPALPKAVRPDPTGP
ncbi:MAG: bifunctional 2-C-methyl-D-erythritol 4-phosphate cytidylyltransferase/2-C-methyl-D-erythritol 2,4-cyclodiphosphate synthase [Rhodospirillales bacterium]|nr:MAG: bifunctional 2-C-methyl-D-erythritol 4-phosphate cytidylyltransferase/2-C-methyl-D-erythritol 2,4-cyclodiphosphate synthase [Rhodospirillales bacterium]